MSATRREALGLIGTSGLAAATLTRPAAVAGKAALEAEEGWQPLFNGRDLSGWTFFQDGVGAHDRDGVVNIENGVLHLLGPSYRGAKAAGMGYLATEREYGNYHLSLEYKWGTRRYDPRSLWKRDSGILYHTRSSKDFLWPDCVEYQIMEHNTGDALPVNHRAVQGLSLGGLPAWPENFPGDFPYAPQIDAGGSLRQWIHSDGVFDTLDGWNKVELIAVGSKAAHIVNGRIVNTLYGLQQQDPSDSKRYVPLDRGRILLQIEAAEIMFRNVRIRPLDAA